MSRRVSLAALAQKTVAPEDAQQNGAGSEQAPAPAAAEEPPVAVGPEPPVVEASMLDESAPTHSAPVEDDPKPRPRAADGKRRNGERRPKQSATPAAGEWVRFDEYERKETRLRDDQYGRLSAASRRLNRQRKGEGERITENTLIRVAIDLLLAQEGSLEGKTESQLRRSVGL